MLLHHEAEGVAKWLGGWWVEPIAVVPVAMLILGIVARIADPDAVPAVLATMVAFSPVWLPFVLFIMFWRRWIHYVRFAFWFRQQMVLLHVELPPEVSKSPLAMELVLTGLHNSGGESTFIARMWKGAFIVPTTLELVCNEGRIGYYIHLRKGWKDFTEARIYGQFPEARITEVDDYVSEVRFNNDDYEMWSTEYAKGSSNVDAMPIKTYVDWELDKDPDTPETKIDPLTNIFEFMSTLGPGERVWVQIVMRPRKGDQWYGFYSKDGGKRFAAEGAERIKKITEGAIKRAQGLIKGEEAKTRAAERGTAQLTEGERDMIGAIERSMGKLVFDCGIRALYIANKGKYNGARIGALVQLWSPFKGANSLGPTRGQSIFTYPWQDWNGIRNRMISRQMFFWYKHRAYFYVPYDQDATMMTTEELASLWHFPSSGVKTPALQRVPSRVSEAPLNLPTAPGPGNLPH